MAKNIVTILHESDEEVTILINGVEVASANHDEHGYAGMDAVVDTATSVGRALGAVVESE